MDTTDIDESSDLEGREHDRSRKAVPKTPKKTPKKPRAPQYDWTDRREKFYLDLMVDGLPRRENGVWPDDFFDTCCQKFQEMGFPEVTVKQLNSKRTAWSKKWRVWKGLKDNSGWGFDEATGMLTADDKTWETAIAADPSGYTRYFRRHPLKWQENMEAVFSEMHATREFVRGPNDPPMERGPTDSSANERSSSVPAKRDRQPAIALAFKRVRKGDQIAEAFQAVSKKYLD